MAGRRTDRSGVPGEPLSLCPHSCFAPKGADGPCIYCKTPMIWDLDRWIAIEAGDVALYASKAYSHYAMHVLPTAMWNDVPEVLIWPERRVPWN